MAALPTGEGLQPCFHEEDQLHRSVFNWDAQESHQGFGDDIVPPTGIFLHK